MWQRIHHAVVGWLLLLCVLPFAVRRRDRIHQQGLCGLRRRIFRLSQLIPVEKAARELAEIVEIAPLHLATLLPQWTGNIIVQDRKALLTVARTLNSWGEFDQAEMLLWRGIRLYGQDRDIWDESLSCALRHLFYSASYAEWQRARHRFDYLLDAVSVPLKDEFPGYLMFGGEQGVVLLDVQQHIMRLWQKQNLREARYALSLWWDRLSAHPSIPDCVIGWAGWSMLGLGLFDTLAQSAAIQKQYPAWIQVSKWFGGEPLPPSSGPCCRNALLLLTRCAQDILEHRRTPAVIWRAWLASRQPDEVQLFYAMFAAAVGLRGDAVRQRMEHWLDSSGGALFLPYLHLLCVAAARMRWELLTRKLWERINLFDVDYPRRGELYRYIHTQIPGIRW